MNLINRKIGYVMTKMKEKGTEEQRLCSEDHPQKITKH